MLRPPLSSFSVLLLVASSAGRCASEPPSNQLRLSGHVEATDVRIAAEVGGRLVELRVEEGTRVAAGDVIARLDTTDTELAITRAKAERAQVDAQLRLLLAGSRTEDVRQAQAQVAVAEGDLAAANAEQSSARLDFDRFEDLLRRDSGSRKQRDDAATRSQVTDERARSAGERVKAARETLARLRAGARPQEIEAARARVAAVDAQLATYEEALADAIVTSPSAGIVTDRLVEPGELLAPRTPLVLLTDLDRAWANLYVDEPMVPRVKLGQTVRIHTDAGSELQGTVSYISSRAEFTPRNVQTAEERSKLVYRIKVAVDNREGILKSGMPVEAQLELQPVVPASPTPATTTPSR